jgi:nitrilase
MDHSELRLTIVQLASGPELAGNLARIAALLGANPAPAELVVLPENCLCFGRQATVRAAARPLDAWLGLLAPWVRGLRAAVVFGGVPVRGDGARVFNAALALGADGALLARYDKMHLFRLDAGRPGGVDETRLYTPGTAPVAVEVAGWRVGLSICYDLRFPELFRALAPADLFLCTAAFAAETGRAHWETLLRARAIENLCYVAGAAQGGVDAETGFACFGHSRAYGPWGEPLDGGDVDSGERVLSYTLSRARLAEVRARLPALAQRCL